MERSPRSVLRGVCRPLLSGDAPRDRLAPTVYHATRYAWKLRLVRGLFERGLAAADVRKLFRLIDWLMALPPPLEGQFRDELAKVQGEKHMPYVTSIERLAKEEGREEGLKLGIRTALECRFGDQGLRLMEEIEDLRDSKLLETILQQAQRVTAPEQLRNCWKKP